MKLLRLEKFELKIEPELLTIKPFKLIWNKDRSESKGTALAEIGFIYHMFDVRSDYSFIIDEEERARVISIDLGLPTKWKPDANVLAAMEIYKNLKPASAILLESSKIAAMKLSKFLRELDLDKEDNSGKPMYSISAITTSLKQVPSLVKALEEAERDVSKDYANSTVMRGQKEKTVLDDGFNF